MKESLSLIGHSIDTNKGKRCSPLISSCSDSLGRVQSIITSRLDPKLEHGQINVSGSRIYDTRTEKIRAK